METASIIYHVSVMIISIIIFFMKITSPNAIFELSLKLLAKIIPLFCMLYAGVQIFKYVGII